MKEELGRCAAVASPGHRPFGVEPASAVSSKAGTPNAGAMSKRERREYRRLHPAPPQLSDEASAFVVEQISKGMKRAQQASCNAIAAALARSAAADARCLETLAELPEIVADYGRIFKEEAR